MTMSVIIPAYQCEASLRKTVSDVIRSELPLAELLLVDDGSTDGTAELCDRLAVEYPQVRCIHKPNGGVSSARNLGLAQATGDYIWFVDADDTVCPIPAEILADCDRRKPGMVLFGMEFDYYRGKRLMKTETLQMPEALHLSADQVGAQFDKLFDTNYLSPVWNKLFHRDLLMKREIRFDPALTNYEDLAFSLDVLSCCESVIVLPDVYYLYQTDYDHDRTVDRISRIDNVAENTDLIAKKFFAVAENCHFSDAAVSAMERTVLQIYLGLFQIKIQTTPLPKVGKQCDDFSISPCFARCEQNAAKLSESTKTLLRRIHKKQTLPIWLPIRLQKVKTRAGKLIKPLLKRA